MSRLHATCVSIGDSGVLLRGPSGSGKSDLALRLIDGGARLISDDQVLLARVDDQVVARAPEALDGLLEVRGLGIVKAPSRRQVALALVVDLSPRGASERLPAPAICRIEGIEMPRLVIAPRHASADAIIRLALRTLDENGSIAGTLGDAGSSPRRVTV